jgi:hypothetical protein
VGVPASVQFDSSYEYGLRLPDGNAVWPPKLWFGHSFQTPEERKRLLQSLLTSINNMSLPLEPTLAQYRWLKRETQVITVEREVIVTDHDIEGELSWAPDTETENACCSPESPDDTVGGGFVQS